VIRFCLASCGVLVAVLPLTLVGLVVARLVSLARQPFGVSFVLVGGSWG